MVPALPFTFGLAAFFSIFLFEAVTPQPSEILTIATAARDIGVVGLMGIGIYALWKDSRGKDAAILDMAKTVTSALNTAASSNSELRHIIEESVRSKVDLAESVKELTVEIKARPCIIEDLRDQRATLSQPTPRRTAGS